MEALTYTNADVAGLLGLSVSTFRKRARGFSERHGMPMRLPGRKRFSRRAIDLWISTYHGTPERVAADGPAVQHNQRLRLHLLEGGLQ